MKTSESFEFPGVDTVLNVMVVSVVAVMVAVMAVGPSVSSLVA